MALIVVCFGAGVLLRRARLLPENTPAVLNGFILYCALPALVLSSLHRVSINADFLLAACMPWIVFLGAALLFLTLSRFQILDRDSALALTVAAGLGNTSFVGFPVLEAFYGPGALPLAVAIDQLGSFLVLTVLALPLMDFYRGSQVHPLVALRRVVTFPPFLALLAAVAAGFREPPALFYSLADRLADTLAPLALFSVGFALQAGDFGRFSKELVLGLSYKLVLAPIGIFWIYTALTFPPELSRIVVVEAAMGPMITGAIVAIQKDIRPALVTAMVSAGIPLSLLTSFGARVWLDYLL